MVVLINIKTNVVARNTFPGYRTVSWILADKPSSKQDITMKTEAVHILVRAVVVMIV